MSKSKQGPSKKATRAKSAVLKNAQAKSASRSTTTVDIGMPVDAAEMARLKEAARKNDSKQ